MRKTNGKVADNTSPPGRAKSVTNRKRTLPIELEDRLVQPAPQRIIRNEMPQLHIPQISQLPMQNRQPPPMRPAPTMAARMPIPPRILPENIPPPPPMPTIEFGSSLAPTPAPEPEPPTTPKKEKSDTPEMITVQEQPMIQQPPQQQQLPQPSDNQQQQEIRVEVQTHDVGESGQQIETPDQWKQFVVESVEGQTSREQSFNNQPDGKSKYRFLTKFSILYLDILAPLQLPNFQNFRFRSVFLATALPKSKKNSFFALLINK